MQEAHRERGTHRQQAGRRRLGLLRAACALLCLCQTVSGMLCLTAGTAWAAGQPGAGTEIQMEEYADGKDYTGWYTVTIQTVDDATSNPVQGVLVTLNSVEKGEAGHGPNINGITRWVTDASGRLEFRIYPGPVTYTARAAAQLGYAECVQYIGAVTQDRQTYTLRLKKQADNTGGSGSGGGGWYPGPPTKPEPDKDKDNQPDSGKDDGKDNTKPGKPDKNDKDKNNKNDKDKNNKNDKDKNNKNDKDKNNKNDKNDKNDKNNNNNNGNNGNNGNNRPSGWYPGGGNGGVPGNGSDTGKDKDKDKDKVTKDEYVLPGKDGETGTEDDITVKPHPDPDGNNNSGQDKDGNVDLPDGGTLRVPTLPDRGDIRVDVPGGTVVAPDGTPTLPDGDQNTTITLPGKDMILDTPDDVTVKPGLDPDGKNNASIDKGGRVDLPDGGEILLPTLPDIGDVRVNVPGGTTVDPDGTFTLPDDNQNIKITLPGKDMILDTPDDLTVLPELDDGGRNHAHIGEDGTVSLPDGGSVYFPSSPDAGKIRVMLPDGSTVTADGRISIPDGTKKGYVLPGPDAVIDTADDVVVDPELGDNGQDNSILREDGSVLLPDGGTVTYPDGTAVHVPGGTVVLADGTIVYPESGSRLGFADCYFHWAELLVLVLLALISMGIYRRQKKSMGRLTVLEHAADTAETRAGHADSIRRKTAMTADALVMAAAVAAAAAGQALIKGHCAADLPLLLVLAVADILATAALAAKKHRITKRLEAYLGGQQAPEADAAPGQKEPAQAAGAADTTPGQKEPAPAADAADTAPGQKEPAQAAGAADTAPEHTEHTGEETEGK